MSKGITKVSSKVNGMSKEAQRASKQVSNMANTFKKKADEMASKAVKFAGIGASIAGAFAIKTGMSEALDLEGYRVQLETATKDTKKAGEIMKWAVDLANKTPFEAGPLVEGASKLEMMGMSAKKYLPLIGDMAAATNKPVDQAVEALIDSQTGELERLKEFGITKSMIEKKSGQMFKNQMVINNKGQIVDQKKFNEALIAIMQDRYKGGMNKLSNTTKGMWSTVTGVTKSALAQMVGMMNDGTIKQGSLLDKVKEKVGQLSSKFEQWQKDGTIDKAAQKFTDGFNKIYNIISKVINYIIEHRETFETLIVTIGGLMIAVKVANAITTAIKGAQIAWALFNGTLALTPLGWVVIAITSVIAIGYALWRNWDTIKAKASELRIKMTEVFEGIKTSITEKIDSIKTSVFEKWQAIKDFLSSPIKGTVDIVKKGLSNAGIGENALGTNYFKGGLSVVGERGPEIVSLPGGARVTTSDKTKQALGGNAINVQVTIQGNVIGNEQYADYVGDHIVSKIKLALNNI